MELIEIITAALTPIEEEASPTAPINFKLFQNYPNPFNPSTHIPYQLGAAGHVRLSIFNSLGQDIRTLVDTDQKIGSYTIPWDCRDAVGRDVAAGLYLYRLKTKEYSASGKMLLLDGS